MIGAAKTIMQGMIGILPVAIGIAYWMTTELYMSFRFRDF